MLKDVKDVESHGFGTESLLLENSQGNIFGKFSGQYKVTENNLAFLKICCKI